MAKREEYTSCMRPYMTGGGPERKERFCIGAKICSKKAETESEAKTLCAQAAANPKPGKKRSQKVAECDISSITDCMLTSIDFNAPKLRDQISSAVATCVCNTPGKTDKKSEFMTQYGFNSE